MAKVIHFEIPADEPERAVAFYSQVFDWKIMELGGPVDYWLAEAGPDSEDGINGAILKRGSWQGGGSSVVNTISVPSVDEFIERITSAGGQVLMPKTAVPGIGYMTYANDTEGNTFGIMELDEAAA